MPMVNSTPGVRRLLQKKSFHNGSKGPKQSALDAVPTHTNSWRINLAYQNLLEGKTVDRIDLAQCRITESGYLKFVEEQSRCSQSPKGSVGSSELDSVKVDIGVKDQVFSGGCQILHG